MTLIEDFMSSFKMKIEEYDEIRKTAHNQLENELKKAGILAIVSSRIKDINKLEEKVKNRLPVKKYKNVENIFTDIVDLVGLRVALYFPSDANKVGDLVSKSFKISETKSFPSKTEEDSEYKKRFSGYGATHFRVYLNDNDDILIEIQVASLLMHAWSEVEHDLIYKKMKGSTSYEEYETLDEINGLVIAGEISLQRLKRITDNRIIIENKQFENHYQMASYIYDELNLSSVQKSVIGDVNRLFNILQKKDRLTPKKLKNDLQYIDKNGSQSISNQIIDKLIAANTLDSEFAFNEAVNLGVFNSNEINEAPNVLKFISKWTTFEKLIRKISRKDTKYGIFSSRMVEELIPTHLLDNYYELRRIRNNIIHEGDIPNENALKDYLIKIDILIDFFKNKK